MGLERGGYSALLEIRGRLRTSRERRGFPYETRYQNGSCSIVGCRWQHTTRHNTTLAYIYTCIHVYLILSIVGVAALAFNRDVYLYFRSVPFIQFLAS